jgi:hypothetical protein
MLTLDAINRVYAAHGGHVPRHQFGAEPRAPEALPQTEPKALPRRGTAEEENHQPPG